MSREKLKTEVRRAQIVQAVFGLMAEQDLEGLSLAAVARRLGVVPSALYRHFRDKDEIKDAVLAHVGERLRANVARVRAEGGGALERLHRLLLLHVRLIRENDAIPRILFTEVLVGGHSDRKARVLRMLRGYLREVGRLVREGQREGAIRREWAPEVVAVLWVGLFQPGAMLWFLSRGTFDITRQAERGWRILRQALQARGPRGAGSR